LNDGTADSNGNVRITGRLAENPPTRFYPVFRYSTLISTIFSILDITSSVFARGDSPAEVQKGM
jgi:hypothetical protein